MAAKKNKGGNAVDVERLRDIGQCFCLDLWKGKNLQVARKAGKLSFGFKLA